MTMQSPAHPATLTGRRSLQQREGAQQIDLFDVATPAQMPAWRDLPEETRGTLTDLLARLILEHARSGTPAVRTEAGHDH